MLRCFLVVGMFVCVACGPKPQVKPDNPEAAEGQKMECEKRRITGSHVSRVVCVNKKQAEARRDQDKRNLRRQHNPRTVPGGGPANPSRN